ncbi:MAG: TlpA family protein disulfide reductase [Bacteroidetes bacterium]|nr:MAG: TlpA family protein disulfide reductase [Bacteroidota bacterium]
MKKSIIIILIIILFGKLNQLSVLAEDNDIKVGNSAPDFSGVTIDGREMKLSEFKGRVILLDFWASWCAPCQKELPYLMQLFDDNDDKNFMIIAVNIDKKIEQAQKFLDKLKEKAHFPIIWDSKSVIPALYKIESMPTTIFIDKTGVIRYIHTGFTDSSKEILKQELEELLK